MGWGQPPCIARAVRPLQRLDVHRPPAPHFVFTISGKGTLRRADKPLPGPEHPPAPVGAAERSLAAPSQAAYAKPDTIRRSWCLLSHTLNAAGS